MILNKKIRVFASCLFAMIAVSTASAQNKKVELRILETSDVHGSFFPYDAINRRPKPGSMARVSSYVSRLRGKYGSNLLLLDNGDILQGQPVSYFSNFIDTTDTNIAAQAVNYLKYDARKWLGPSWEPT